MPNLDETMSVIADLVLKRPLSEDEKLEIYKISDAMGMTNVQSFLYLLLVFKLHEDMLKGQFSQLDSLEARLGDTLKSSIDRILGDGAARIGRDMGDHIAEMAKEALGARDDYQFFRGQVRVVCVVSTLATLAYWLGTVNALRAGDYMGPFEVLFMLPAGWWIFFCCSLHTFMWSYDHWDQVKQSVFYKSILALQCFILVALFAYFAL